jgi:hypothetical protein
MGARKIKIIKQNIPIILAHWRCIYPPKWSEVLKTFPLPHLSVSTHPFSSPRKIEPINAIAMPNKSNQTLSKDPSRV